MAAVADRRRRLSAADAERWLAQLADAGTRGQFFWAVTMFAVAGTRPPSQHPTSDRKEPTMSLFAVTREAGPAWTEGKGAFDQPGVNDHAAFMNGLADDGFVAVRRTARRHRSTAASASCSSPTPTAKPTSINASPPTPGNAQTES